MKKITLIVSTWISGFLAQTFCIWAIIEFIVYLVKDKAFNWLSVWLFIASVVLFILLMILAIITNGKTLTKDFHSTKSKFQQRLEDMQNKRMLK